MADTKISAGADPGTLAATDKLPLARSASTTAYAATMAEIASYANTAYTPNYSAAPPIMDGTAAPGVAAAVSRGDHRHPTDLTLLPRGGGTMTGALVLAADPAAALEATTRQYVDGQIDAVAGTAGVSGYYNARTTTQAAADPSNGNITWNTTGQANATQIYVSAMSAAGNDISVIWKGVVTPQQIIIQRKNNSSQNQVFTITSVTDNSGWFTLAVTPVTNIGAPFSNTNNLFVIIPAPSASLFLPLSGGTMTGPVALAGNSTATTPSPGDNDTSIATTAFVQSALGASGAGVSTWNTRAGAVVLQQADVAAVGALHDAGRNLIHNGLFSIAQRGTGPWTTSVYTADRWFLGVSLDTVNVNVVAAIDADRAQIGDEAATRYLQNTFTGNAGAAAVSYVHQPMEGVRRFAGKTVTVSFWAAASSASLKLGVNIYQNFGSGGSPSAGVWALATGNAITPGTTWTRYTTTIAIPGTTGKTVGTNGDDGTWLRFFYSAGSSSAAMAGNIGVQSGTINLWGVQLEIGSVVTPLDYGGSPQQQLAACMRYYQIGAGTSAGGTVNATGIYIPIAFAVPMRATPTVTQNLTGGYGYTAGTAAATNSAVMISAVGTSTSYNLSYSFTASADL